MFIKNHPTHVIAMGLSAVILAVTIIPQVISAFDLNPQWTNPAVVPTWNETVTDPDIKPPYFHNYEKTGLAFNTNFYFGAGKNGWDLGGQMYLEERPGYDNSDYSDFNMRHTYCTGNHTKATKITPGVRSFKSGEYYYSDDLISIFPEAQKNKTNVKFNFLILAIACYYPGDYQVDYTINQNAMSIAEDSAAAQGLVSQMIAWICTNEKSKGFTGIDWDTDFAIFNSSPYYDIMMNNFAKHDPQIHNALHGAPLDESGAKKAGMTNNADAWFWDIWQSARLTAKLVADWDKEISKFNIAIQESDGEYHVEIDLFVSEAANIYLDGIQFEPYGDWKYRGPKEDGKQYFTSASGEVDENGSIGYLYWPNNKLGYFMPVDQTKAKIVTFDTWNALADPKGFGNTQTQFAAHIEKGLNIYLTIGSDGGGDYNGDVVRHKHTENWCANYNVNLYKFDSETGKAIENSHWDILEKFDDSQLDDTDLDRQTDDPGSYESGLGGLVSTTWGDDEISSNYEGDLGVTVSDTNKYNWGNDGGTQFVRWDDPHNDPCKRDDNVTGSDGQLYEVNSSGNISSDVAHTDIYSYTYHKGYCTGHPAPDIEYVECDHDGEAECDCEAINQELHDEAWAAWYEEVKICEELVSQGGFFHCIEPGDAAQKAMEQDRDQFYKDFISLTYDYSAKEIAAAGGYILHGTHTDDIPIEWRTVTSSEYKDTDEATSIDHNGSSGENPGDGEGEEEDEDTFMAAATSVQTTSSPVSAFMKTSVDAVPKSANILDKSKSIEVWETLTDDDDDVIADIDIFDDKTVVINATGSDATGSNATPSDSIPKTQKTHTGFIDVFGNKISSFIGFSDDNDDDETGSYLRNTLIFIASKANTVKAAVSDIIDWTFIAYDHRTEGEIHFNKQDFNLSNAEDFDGYGQENADGTLEGAVYGLFAAEDIIHPDTSGSEAGEYDTGIVFKKDDLVAITITDRNGDGSFPAITEAPGSVYNYETGRVEHTDWYDQAPKNLHMAEDESAAKEDDIEQFIGHNSDNSKITAGNGGDLTDTAGSDGSHTEDFFFKYSSNQRYDGTYREDETTGRYPISNNEGNNGNCWIGRPVIVGANGTAYYIKELSRSEGYELSVYGKNSDLITNRNAFEDGDITTSNGVVTAGSMSLDRAGGGVTYTISSSDTDNGYEVHLINVPEGATISLTATENVWDDEVSHYEEVITIKPIIAEAGTLVTLGGHTWAAVTGDTISYNGKTYSVNNVHTVTHDKQSVSPDNTEKLENSYLNAASITESGDVISDINKLFSSIGYRNVITGSPWTVIEADSLTVADITKAVNEQIFTNDWYSVFNAMQMSASYYANGHLYIVISYCYRYSNVNHAIYNDANDSVYVRTPVQYTNMPGGGEGFIYRVYAASDCENIIRNSNGFITKATVPNQTAAGTAVWQEGDPYDTVSFTTKPAESFWAYAEGEQLLRGDGSYAYSEEKEIVSVTPTLVPKITNTEISADSYSETGRSAEDYGYGTYTYTMTQETLDALANGQLDFRLTFDGDSYTARLKELFAADNGLVSTSLPMVLSGSYIERVLLVYPGKDTVIQDAGTGENPIMLQERPIRQKIKVSKDIETLADVKQVWYCLNCGYENNIGLAACEHCATTRTTEETKTIYYDHDTYSAVHSENISADRDGGVYSTVKDWLTKLLNNESEGETAQSIPNFRFKAYLKSNLERIYRDQDGNIIWLDRNGNTMTPRYQDTNGDGNYDTFTWNYDTAYEGKGTDFPEKDTISDSNELESSNVQKIYTKVEHNTYSMTTSAQANNVWDDYDTPQGGARDNVGEKDGFSTSQREKTDGGTGDLSGKAVDSNAALYSYNGRNTNTGQTDRINADQNIGCTRVLEISQSFTEDGAGAGRQTETYNYEKFFDAIYAANTDIWDNDMHSTYTGTAMNNYPGQHWFQTFYEKYQKDDADPDHTPENTDGADQDNTAGGDRDTSFKPFPWIREHVFGNRADYETYPAGHGGANTEVIANTSEFARANAEASDAVRQFAVKWYLEDEAAKLMTNNGVDEDIAEDADGTIRYDEAVYDEALFHAIAKTYNYLKPFYLNDLDTIVSGEKSPSDKVYANQNTGYFTTPQPIGAGVYVLAEIKAPDGYARSKPVPFEVYSDQTQYYVDGDMYNKVSAVRYEE